MSDAHDNKTTGYHLFLEPPEPLRGQLQNIILGLGGVYENNIFRPHVTLLGRITASDEAVLIEHVKRLSAQTTPFLITLGEIGMEDHYFRALYLRVERNEVLESLHDLWTLKIAGATDTRAFVPHLSLFYGDLAQEEKEKMISSLVLPEVMTFMVDTVHLYKTEGEVSNWKKIGEFQFSK